MNPIDNDSLTYKIAYWLGRTYGIWRWCKDFVAVVRIGQEDAGRDFWKGEF